MVVKDDRQVRWNGNQNYASEQIDASNLDRLTKQCGHLQNWLKGIANRTMGELSQSPNCIRLITKLV